LKKLIVIRKKEKEREEERQRRREGRICKNARERVRNW
jgi:hypothetical protein|tara:strand:+ start:455 stop:568 length:114 start_codon:yes stop_codon:yes gene_type:complete